MQRARQGYGIRLKGLDKAKGETEKMLDKGKVERLRKGKGDWRRLDKAKEREWKGLDKAKEEDGKVQKRQRKGMERPRKGKGREWKGLEKVKEGNGKGQTR